MTIYSLDVLPSRFGTQSVVPCPVLTVVSWSAYRFLKRQVRWSGIPISFRIFLSLLWSTLLGSSMKNSAHVKGHEEGGFSIRTGGIKPLETPCSRASTPKSRVCFMLSPTPLTLWGAVPPPPLSEKELTYSSKSIKILGHDKSVSTYELLWRLSSLPERVSLATCDCLQPPNRERHEML